MLEPANRAHESPKPVSFVFPESALMVSIIKIETAMMRSVLCSNIDGRSSGSTRRGMTGSEERRCRDCSRISDCRDPMEEESSKS
jgi:hypothetical protein